MALPNRKVEHDDDEDIDRIPREASALESPLCDRRHGFFIEATAVQGSEDVDLRRASVACDNGFQYDRALNSASPVFFDRQRVSGLRGVFQTARNSLMLEL